MVIPMGTVIAVCMLLCVIFANRFPNGALNSRLPASALRIVGCLTATAGLWNILWFALRNITQFWGQMALGSGLLLCALSVLLILPPARTPPRLEAARHIMVLALAGFAGFYAWTIYNL